VGGIRAEQRALITPKHLFLRIVPLNPQP